MSFSSSLKSHPDKLLFSHLENVGNLSKSIVDSKHLKHKAILSEIAYLIGVSHDFGKATTFFQKWMSNREERTEKARHSLLSSFVGYYIVKKYLSKKGKIKDFQHLPIMAWIVIKRHHGNIQNVMWNGLKAEICALDEKNKDLVQAQIDDIAKHSLNDIKVIYEKLLKDFNIEECIEKIRDWEDLVLEMKKETCKICIDKKVNHFFNILFFYSVLLDADKTDASETKIPLRIKDFGKIMVDQYKKRKFGISRRFVDKVREEAYEEVNNYLEEIKIDEERILAINLPTGMGKTLTGLAFSFGLREKIERELSFTPRILYCLPFLSIIDQNSRVIEDLFKIGGKRNYIPSNLFLKHHHLADVIFKTERDGELTLIKDINKSLILMEGWNSEIVITTFIQFFHSLITNRNRAARKFHNITNSIIILDEIQSIPHKYWLLIKRSLAHLAEEFGCWIILMTATQPLIFDETKEIKQLVQNREKYFKVYDRVDFIFDLDENGRWNETEFNLFKQRILNEVSENTQSSLMVVLNTISSCKELYEFLKEKLAERCNSDPEIDEDGVCVFPDLDLINLSTNILPSFRLKKIDRIKEERGRRIIITTQLVEAGVDISVDVIYRDMAPLDCVIQAAGRCNRNNETDKGKVYVVLLKDQKGKKFYSYIYDTLLTEITKKIIGGFYRKIVSEKDFTAKATAKYYKLLKDRMSNDVSRGILDNIRKLNFGDVSEFKLIEKIPTISVFIETDEKAEKIRREVEQIFEFERGFKKKERLREIRKGINENTISVRYSAKTKDIECLPILESEFFRYVPRDELDNWYKLDTGFYIPEEEAKII